MEGRTRKVIETLFEYERRERAKIYGFHKRRPSPIASRQALGRLP